MSESTPQGVLFPTLLEKPVEVSFDLPDSTSDGGAFLLKAVDDSLRLTQQLTSSMVDGRTPGRVRHELGDLLRQRVFGLACGYPDANDAARLGNDPMHRALVGKSLTEEAGLASQPTICRFENGVRRVDLFRMGVALAESVVTYHRKRLRCRKIKRITIDMDLTDDPVHGGQQLALFNGHYDNWCYLPLLGFLTFDDEPEQYLFAAVLRPGTSAAKSETIGVLSRIIPLLRERFPKAKIRVRLDGGFAGPKILGFLEEQRVEYLIALPSNRVLGRRSRRLMGTARRLSRESGQSEALYGETQYDARSWRRKKRRVIFKAEVVRLAERQPRDNARYVVTNLRLKPESVYDIYRRRGDCENRIKELDNELAIGRTSCSSFWANQFRVLLTAAAFVLFQTMRSRFTGNLKCAQVRTLRLRLLKIAGHLKESVRRFALRLAENHVWKLDWRRAAIAWGACPSP